MAEDHRGIRRGIHSLHDAELPPGDRPRMREVPQCMADPHRRRCDLYRGGRLCLHGIRFRVRHDSELRQGQGVIGHPDVVLN